jgi:hypothetical protein
MGIQDFIWQFEGVSTQIGSPFARVISRWRGTRSFGGIRRLGGLGGLSVASPNRVLCSGSSPTDHGSAPLVYDKPEYPPNPPNHPVYDDIKAGRYEKDRATLSILPTLPIFRLTSGY